MSRYISIKTKRNILEKQAYKCARIKDYECLLWKYNNGLFDESGYEFDHIDEFSLTHNNSENNIQALCPCCHAVKTKRFRKCKYLLSSPQIDNGGGLMDIEKPCKKRKKVDDNDLEIGIKMMNLF